MHQLTDKKSKIIIYLMFLFILSSINGKYIKNQNSYSSKINQIYIEGLSNVEKSKIYIELNNLLHKNLLFVRKEEFKKVIKKYNIIEEYNIKKIYPSSINIKIKPTKFVARTYKGDQLLVGANGKFIENKENDELLPYIFGEFNSKDFLHFKKNIDKSKFIFTEFKTLFFFPSGRWDILTNDNILIKLPLDNFLESLNLAYKIIANNDFKNKNLIDLRVDNHLIINSE